jgi:hypothetical protein
MRPWNLSFRLSILALFFAASLAAPHEAGAQTTTWIGSLGDWGTASNWSDGVPTAGVDAVVPGNATVMVTLPSEVCRNLTTGTSASNTTLRFQSGDLTVGQTLDIGPNASSAVEHFGGAISAGELILGSTTSASSYTMTGGTLTLGSAQIGSDQQFSSGLFTMSATTPMCTITGPLSIGATGSVVCGAGTLHVGTTSTDTVRVRGTLSVSNAPEVTMTRLTITGTGIFSVGIGVTGVPTVIVSGQVDLAGTFQILDILASDGTYEVLRGNPVVGTFDTVFLPSGWSWRIDGNSLLVIKATQAVESTSWGRVKRQMGVR